MASGLAVSQYDFSDFDGGLSHLLAKLETKTAGQVVNDQANEVDADVLYEVRLKLFNLCKENYEGRLREAVIITEGESVDISLAKRHNKNDSDKLAEDTVKLYGYAVGLNNDFPKDLLTRSSKYKDIKPREESEEEGEELGDISAPKETLHQKLFNIEMMNLIKEQGRAIEKLSRESRHQKEQISILTIQLQEAELKIETVGAHTNATSEGLGSPSSDPQNTNKDDKNESQQSIPEGEKGTPHCFICVKPKDGKNILGPLPANSGKAAVTHITEKNGDHTTYLHKLGTSQSKHIEAYHLESREQPKSNNGGSKTPSRFRGVRQEKGTMLYLEGIQVEYESDEEIKAMIKAHARENGLRVMFCRIIHHRMFHDSVSCKLLIPESQEHLALSSSFWPEDVRCRRWSSEAPRARSGGYEGYKESGWGDNDRDNSWSRMWSNNTDRLHDYGSGGSSW